MPQAISGVAPGVENVTFVMYPSVGATGIGRLLGTIYDSIPLKIGGIKLSHLLFTLPLAPLAALIYGSQKAFGVRYVLTSRSVQIWQMFLGAQTRLVDQIPLSEIGEVDIVQRSGHAFYKAADVLVRDKGGKVALTLPGVPRADVFRETILKSRDAHSYTAASLAAIQARHQ